MFGKILRTCQTNRLNYCTKVATACIYDHQINEGKIGSVGELSTVCSQIGLKCLYWARIGRPDILWSVNMLARAITKLTKACDKRLARLVWVSYIHHTREYRQYCFVGNTAQKCRSGLFIGSDFAGDLEDLKSDIMWNSLHFRKPYVCAKKLDVQETDFSFS